MAASNAPYTRLPSRHGGQKARAYAECGDTITQSTTFDSDLVCAGPSLVITGDNITLNLAGHSVTGSGTGTGIRLVNTSATVENGTVQGFGIGVDAVRANPSRIVNVRAVRNGTGFSSESSIVIKCSEALYNTFDGLDLSFMPNVVLERNVASNNGGDGIHIEHSGGLLTKNTADRNGGLGIFNQAAVDGGKNKARKNGDPRQCVGVSC